MSQDAFRDAYSRQQYRDFAEGRMHPSDARDYADRYQPLFFVPVPPPLPDPTHEQLARRAREAEERAIERYEEQQYARKWL